MVVPSGASTSISSGRKLAFTVPEALPGTESMDAEVNS